MATKHMVETITKQQEIFINELIKGATQRQAYLKAYPDRKNWKGSSLDVQASKLFKKDKIRQRYDELLSQIREREQKKTIWTREESIETLKYIIEINKRDLERIQKAMDDELEFLQQQLIEQPERVVELVEQLIKKRKSRVASQVNNKGIIEAVAELNRMQGFNEETINLNGTVVFTGEDELED